MLAYNFYASGECIVREFQYSVCNTIYDQVSSRLHESALKFLGVAYRLPFAASWIQLTWNLCLFMLNRKNT